MSDLSERHFSNETGEFLFELSLSNMTTIFECDIQLSASQLNQYRNMLANGQAPATPHQLGSSGGPQSRARGQKSSAVVGNSAELMSLETNYFTFGAFDWSLTILPLVIPSSSCSVPPTSGDSSSNSSSVSSGQPGKHPSPNSPSNLAAGSTSKQKPKFEPVCRVYLNRLNGLDCLCRVKYRVILGHHQPNSSSQQVSEFADSRPLDQISDLNGKIRGYQFRNTNILKLIALRSTGGQQQGSSSVSIHKQQSAANSLDLRVHIEMFRANTVSEAQVPLQRRASESQVSNCSDRNKQVSR